MQYFFCTKCGIQFFKPADIEFPREKPEGITVDRTAGGSETILKMVRKASTFRPVAARTFISILLPAILVVKIASAMVLVLAYLAIDIEVLILFAKIL